MAFRHLNCSPVSYTHLDVYKRQGIERPPWAAAVLRVDVPRALGLAAGSEILAVRR